MHKVKNISIEVFTMTDRSAVNRIFNDTEASPELEDDLDGEIDSRNVDYSIFSKLLNAANGTVVLTPTDVDQVIAIICKTMNSGGNLAPREETTAAIVDLLGTTAESCDEALLKYLTTNYTRLEHQSAEQENETSISVSSVPSNKRLTLEVKIFYGSAFCYVHSSIYLTNSLILDFDIYRTFLNYSRCSQ